jgi:hypothetical protein
MKRPCSWHEGQDGSNSISTDLAARTFRKELQLTHRTHIFDAVAEPQDCASVHPGLRFPALVLFGAAAMTGAEHWQARLVLYPGVILPANHATRTSVRPTGSASHVPDRNSLKLASARPSSASSPAKRIQMLRSSRGVRRVLNICVAEACVRRGGTL